VPLINGLNVLMLVGIALMPILAKRIGKRNTALLGMAIGAGSQLIVYGGVVMSSVSVLVAAVIIGNIGIGFTAGLMYAMLADTVDYGEWKSGVRSQGLLTASSSFGVKFGMGIGGALAAWILATGSYVPNGTQAASGLAAIQFNFVWTPFICFMICVLLYLFYKIDPVEKQMISELETRRERADTAHS